MNWLLHQAGIIYITRCLQNQIVDLWPIVAGLYGCKHSDPQFWVIIQYKYTKRIFMDQLQNNRQSAVFQVLGFGQTVNISALKQQLAQPSYRFGSARAQQGCRCGALTQRLQQMQLHILELQAKNKELVSKLGHSEYLKRDLSRQSIKMVKKTLQMQDQIRAQSELIELIKSRQAHLNEKYIIVEGQPNGQEDKRVALGGEGKKQEEEAKEGAIEIANKERKGRVQNAPSIDERIEDHLTSYMIEMSEGKSENEAESIQGMLECEKARLVKCVANFNVVIQTQRKTQGWSNWLALKSLASLFTS